MKNKKRNEKSLDKFKASTQNKRRAREKSRRELMKIIDGLGVGNESLVIRDSFDEGRGRARSMKMRSDETRAVGEFSSSRSGFGFVSIEGREDDIFIPEGRTQSALDGDVVEIIYHEYENRFGEKKTEGRVTKIVEFSRKTVIGRVDREEIPYSRRRKISPEYILIPDDAHLSDTFLISELGGASVGDKVEARINRSTSYGPHTVSVLRSFGDAYCKEANYEAILAEYKIDVDFTPAQLSEAEFFAALPITDEGRVRRTETIFTIDGADAKDLDDAVSLRKIRGGWQLGVHIADVSYYVRERTHLDRAAMARGTSVYFTDKVVPMLPAALSNGACSLNSNEDKYTLSAIINLDSEGEIKSVKIEPSIINSKVRGVYSEVNEILSGTANDATRAKYKPVLSSLLRMQELYLVLSEKSKRRGALSLDGSEPVIILSEDGAPIDIVRRERGVSERIIEEFMICANEAVAKYLSDQKIPCVYRVHEPPPREKLSEFITYVHNLGFDTRYISAEKSEAKDLSALLDLADERELLPQVSYTMLRSMAKAKYSDVRQGHFGLALEYYCHFTSPIRRLSDLATHRIIHSVLLSDKRKDAYVKYAHRAAAAATEAELRAVGAERRIENLYKVIYMSDKIGETFSAVVNSVTNFGFFCELENTCEGLVPISELRGMFTYDEKNLTLRSRNKIYRIGDRVEVRLAEADIIRGKLRFEVV